MSTLSKTMADAMNAKASQIKDLRNDEMAASAADAAAKLSNVRSTMDSSETAKADELAADTASEAAERSTEDGIRDEQVTTLKESDDEGVKSLPNLLQGINDDENSVTSNINELNDSIGKAADDYEAEIGSAADVAAIFAPAPTAYFADVYAMADAFVQYHAEKTAEGVSDPGRNFSDPLYQEMVAGAYEAIELLGGVKKDGSAGLEGVLYKDIADFDHIGNFTTGVNHASNYVTNYYLEHIGRWNEGATLQIFKNGDITYSADDRRRNSADGEGYIIGSIWWENAA